MNWARFFQSISKFEWKMIFFSTFHSLSLNIHWQYYCSLFIVCGVCSNIFLHKLIFFLTEFTGFVVGYHSELAFCYMSRWFIAFLLLKNSAAKYTSVLGEMLCGIWTNQSINCMAVWCNPWDFLGTFLVLLACFVAICPSTKFYNEQSSGVKK